MEFNNYTAMDAHPYHFTAPAVPQAQHSETDNILERAILWEMEKEMKRREIIEAEIDWMRRNEFSYVMSSSTARAAPDALYPVTENRGMPEVRIQPRATTTVEKHAISPKKRKSMNRSGVRRLKL